MNMYIIYIIIIIDYHYDYLIMIINTFTLYYYQILIHAWSY